MSNNQSRVVFVMQALVREIPFDLGYDFRSELIGEKLGVMAPVIKDKKGPSILISNEVYTCLLDSTFNLFFQKSSKVQGFFWEKSWIPVSFWYPLNF